MNKLIISILNSQEIPRLNEIKLRNLKKKVIKAGYFQLNNIFLSVKDNELVILKKK